MGKKRSGGKKNKQSPSTRPPQAEPTSKRPVAPTLDLTTMRGAAPSVSPEAPSVHAVEAKAAVGPVIAMTSGSVSSPPPPPDSLAPTSHDSDVSPEIAAAATEARAIAESIETPVSASSGRPIVEDETPPGIALETVGRHPSSRKLAVAEDDADHAFFAGEAAAVAKMHAEEFRTTKAIEVELERPKRVVITPQMIERQKRLRKVVTGVIGFSALVAILAVLRVATASKPAFEPPPMTLAKPPEPAAVVVPAKLEAPAQVDPPAAEAKKTDEPAPAEKTSEAPAAPAKVEEKADDKKSDAKAEEKADEKKADQADVSAPDPVKAKPLTKKALQLLEMGKNTAAIEEATASVQADPTDANPYLYWGTALMNLGKIAESKTVFRACVDKATRGPKNDCRAFK